MTITIPFNDRTVPFVAEGGETELDLDFPVVQSPLDGQVDVRVYRRRAGVEAELAYPTDFTVTGIGQQEGAKVVLAAPAEEDDIYVVDGARAPARVTNFQNHRSLSALQINDELNRQIILLQEMRRDFGRTLRRAPTTGEEIGGGWDMQGLRLENVAQGQELTDGANIRDVVVRIQNAGGGDMSQEIYDPTGVAGDAFHMDNMAEGADTKIMTEAERARLAQLGTDGAPQFEAIKLGHETDTTMTRSAPGVPAVSGKDLAFQEPGLNAQTGTSYTLVAADKARTVSMNNVSANTLTIPLHSSVAFPVGSIINILRLGSGVTTIQAATGVTLNGVSGGSGAIPNRYQGVALTKIDADVWIASGDIETVA